MTEEVFIPKFGQTVEEVTLIRWLVEDGQRVEQGQEILDVETDKAVFSVEATARGYIHFGPYKEGDVVPVITTVAIIGKQEEEFPVAKAAKAGMAAVGEEHLGPGNTDIEPDGYKTAIGETGSEDVVPAQQERVFASPRARRLAAEKKIVLAKVTPTGGGGRRVVEQDVIDFIEQQPKATPLAQKVAAEAGVDIATLSGSGPGGRITREDVQKAAALPPQTPATISPTPTFPPSSEQQVVERTPLKGVRGVIAERMGASAHSTARVTLFMEVDATELVALRERLKARYSQTWGFTPGYNDLLAKLTAIALRRFPYMNARLSGEFIEQLAHINLGMAVDTPRGLIVPVIHDADKKSLQQFGKEFRARVQKAQQATLLPDEMSGGTFTITNLGMFDVMAFTPVINLPEAAILGVGKITPSPKRVAGEWLEYQKLVLSLVFDHRVVDGAPAARFLQFLKDLVEDPGLLVTL
jgi:pyruvate dehydrogenase E2 component (dihydrolipoamide acetyltransferase)